MEIAVMFPRHAPISQDRALISRDGTMGLVLIVEDDGWTRFALARIFEHEGWEVRTASTLAEGLVLLDLEPDCVLLDLSLPDGNGAAILRKIREEGRTIRTVLCTVLADDEKLASIAGLRPDAVFVKPVEVNDLLAACSRGTGS